MVRIQPLGRETVISADPVAARLALVERNTAELLTRDELRSLLSSGQRLKHYIGFEISGRIHLGAGLVCMAKVRDFMEAGIDCNVLLADWHTWINDKLGGDREAIRRVACGYFREGLRAGLRCVGGDPDRLNFVLGSDLIATHDDYLAAVIDVAKHTSLARMQRSISILGREEGDTVDFAKLIYPAMQAADIFCQSVHLAHAGIDQRKAHVIARDVALQLTVAPLRDATGARIKPCAVHHPLILGLGRPPQWPIPAGDAADVAASMKMSKSDPRSAVFIHDPPEVIRDKVRRAFCPPRDASYNPVLDWFRHIVFPIAGAPVRVAREDAHGGPVSFASYAELEDAFAGGALHPNDAKAALCESLIDILEPARAHFAEPGPRAMLDELDRLLGATASERP